MKNKPMDLGIENTIFFKAVIEASLKGMSYLFHLESIGFKALFLKVYDPYHLAKKGIY